MKKLLTLLAVIIAAISANAAMVEQTYEYTFTEAATFKSPGDWQMGTMTWNVSAVKEDGSNAPCSWNAANSAQQIGGNTNYAKTITMTTSGITGTVTGITITAASTNSTKYSCTASVGTTTVIDAGKVTKIEKPVTATDLSATGEIKLVFTQTAEVTDALKGSLAIQKISITYMAEASGPVDFDPNFSAMELAIGQTKGIVLPAMHPDIELSSSNPETVTVAGTDLTGVATGNATITATWKASEIYNAGSASFEVTVNNNQVVTFDFNTNTYDLTVENTVPSEFSDKTISNNPVTITMTGSCFLMAAVAADPDNGVTAAPQLLRILGNPSTTTTPGVLTISVPDGHKILSITFDGNNTAKFSPNAGKKSNGAWLPDGADVSSVTLTYEGDCKINKIMVEQYPAVPTGVGSIAAPEIDNQVTEYYNLNGIRVPSDRLSSGIYIAKKGSVTKKVIVR